LIVMVIISILAALVLGVAAVAGETARESQSKHTVLRLHKLLMAHPDTYKTRRVRVRQQVLDGIELQNLSPAKKGELKAQARLNALRELMILELPDRWSDVTLTDSAAVRYPYFLDVSQTGTGRTALSSIYLRRCQQMTPSADNQSAECLYMIITLACGEGEARSQFGEGSIGDTDNDGAPEFLDGWGRPIHFLRWAPGFDSQVQINANTLGAWDNNVWRSAASGDHDPFDLYRVDPMAFRLVPLIYSAGRDESFGILTLDSYVAMRAIPNTTATSTPNSWPKPAQATYYPIADENGLDWFLGTNIPNGGSADNIHNHLLGRR